MTPKRTDLLDAALAYAALGWPVSPLHSPRTNGSTLRCDCNRDACDSPAKHPRNRDGLKGATIDEAQIRTWWTQWPHANIAVRTGQIAPDTYLLVLDVDPHKGGDDTLDELLRAHGPLPATKLSLTGGGGRHFVFVGPEPVRTTSGQLGPGLDTRGGGGAFGSGYIVAPPSLHISGRTYEWDVGQPELPTTSPPWLIALANRGASTNSKHAPAELGERILDGQNGGRGRKRTLHSLGRSMRTKGLTADEIFAALATINANRCEPPLDEKDVRRVAESAASVAPGHSPGYEPRRAPDDPPAPVPEPPAAPPDEFTPPPDNQWLGLLRVNDKGNPIGSLLNVVTILRFDERYAGRLSYDESRLSPALDGRAFLDEDVVNLRALIEEKYGFAPKDEDTRAALLSVSTKRRFHPVRTYLDSLTWDRTPRLGALCLAAMHVDATEIAQRMLRSFFAGAVQRILEPGCKFDTALVLVGPQGSYKSGFFRVLAAEWFNDSHMDIRNKDAYLQLAASWIYEWAEVDAIMNARDAAEVKAFLTSSVDVFRPPYERTPRRVPRSCVIVGSTNRERFLNDPTGSRRFHILRVSDRINLDAVRADRDQLWAEAIEIVRSREEHWLTPEQESARETDAERHTDEDPWERIVRDWLRQDIRDDYTSDEILAGALKLDAAHMDKPAQNRLGRILHRLGLARRKKRITRCGTSRPPVWAWEWTDSRADDLDGTTPADTSLSDDVPGVN